MSTIKDELNLYLNIEGDLVEMNCSSKPLDGMLSAWSLRLESGCLDQNATTDASTVQRMANQRAEDPVRLSVDRIHCSISNQGPYEFFSNQ